MERRQPAKSFVRSHLLLCGLLVAAVVIVAVAFVAATPLLVLLLVCLAMIGGMVWMMRSGQGHGHH